MADTIKVLRERYAAKAKRAKEMVDKAEAEDRGLNQEERSEYDACVSEALSLKERIQRQEDDLKRIDSELFASDRREKDDEHEWREGRRSFNENVHDKVTNVDRRRALKAWLTRGKDCTESDHISLKKMGRSAGVDLSSPVLTLAIDRGRDEFGNEFAAPKSIAEAKEQARARQRAEESRAVVGTDSLGGFTVPDEMLGAIEINLLAYGAVRQVATVFSTETGEKYSIPTVNDTSNEGRLLAEDVAVTTMETTFGQTSLNAYKFSSDLIPVSLELLQDSRTNMPSLIGNLLSERLARGANRFFTTGTGSGQPQGVTQGATTSGVTTANATTISLPNIQGLAHSLDPAYRVNGMFMMNDATALILRNLADTTGRPLWQLGMAYGLPDTIAGFPYMINQHMPSGASSRAIVFGDFSKMYIREVLSLQLTRLDERYAEFHRTAFIAVVRYDSRVINAGTAPLRFLTMGA